MVDSFNNTYLHLYITQVSKLVKFKIFSMMSQGHFMLSTQQRSSLITSILMEVVEVREQYDIHYSVVCVITLDIMISRLIYSVAASNQ